jgi:hypothetical protein
MTMTHTELSTDAYSLLHSPDGPVVAASPGDGWMIEATRKETNESWTERVVAWVIHANGTAVPALVDEPDSGGTWFPTRDAQFRVRIFHPSHPAQNCAPAVPPQGEQE